ncbi:MAG TPA: hypothetical protein VMR37_04115 [Rhabdochlamydiaceae bacterium]|nr:hypothetical protein [Rhabdochlamydiaceae bacterium]
MALMTVHLSAGMLVRIVLSPFQNPTSLPHVERNLIRMTGRWTLGAGSSALILAILGRCLKHEGAVLYTSLFCRACIFSGFTSAALFISFVNMLRSYSGNQLHLRTLRLEIIVTILGIAASIVANIGSMILIKNKAACRSFDQRHIFPLVAYGLTANFFLYYHRRQLRKCNFKIVALDS